MHKTPVLGTSIRETQKHLSKAAIEPATRRSGLGMVTLTIFRVGLYHIKFNILGKKPLIGVQSLVYPSSFLPLKYKYERYLKFFQVSKLWNILALDGSNWQRIDLFEFQRDVEVSNSFFIYN